MPGLCLGGPEPAQRAIQTLAHSLRQYPSTALLSSCRAAFAAWGVPVQGAPDQWCVASQTCVVCLPSSVYCQ